MVPFKSSFPFIPDDLFKAIRSKWIDRLPSKELSQFEWGRLVGQQDVIRHLEQQREDQFENSLR